MNTNKYGFITDKEAALIDGLLLDIQKQFGAIRFLEIGVMAAGTVKGIYQRAHEIQCPVHCEGIDFVFYKPNPTPDAEYVFHGGDSLDMWRTMTGEFNLLFVDGCHCCNHAMLDFLNYSPMVVVNGYALFHDTAGEGPENKQGEWPQDHSYAGKPPSTLGVREGLRKIGLLQGHRADWRFVTEIKESDLMGMCLFQKVKALV